MKRILLLQGNIKLKKMIGDELKHNGFDAKKVAENKKSPK
jgi:hypothetical protein